VTRLLAESSSFLQPI